MNLKNLLVIALAMGSLNVYAGTSLPYMGPKSKSCNVHHPEDASGVDAGYIADEDCDIIYVLPPVEGVMKYSSISEMREVAYCPMVNNLLSRIADSQDKVPTVSNDEAEKLGQDIIRLDATLDQIAAGKVVTTISGSAQLQWQKLVDSYGKANPGINVRKMPIALGVLTTKLYRKDRFAESPAENGAIGIDVYGLGLPEDYDDIGNSPLPDYIKRLTSNEGFSNVLMGEGVGFSLFLNLKGACTFKKNSKFSMASTYTYFYPVQDNTLLGVQWDDQLLEKEIMDIAKEKHERVSTEELYNAINGKSEIISVKTNAGAFGSDADVNKLEVQYKADLIKLALDNILSIVSNNMESIVESATYNQVENRYERNCRHTWYGKKKCSTNYYTINTKKINWESVRAQLQSLLAKEKKSGEAEVDAYKTFYMMGSTAMLPLDKTIQNKNKRLK